MVVSVSALAPRALHRLLAPLGVPQPTPRTGARAPVLLQLDGWHAFATTDGGPDPQLRLDLEEVYENFVSERWAAASANRRLSDSRLDLFYRVKRFVPRRAQLWSRRQLIRWQGTPTFPSWPLDEGVSRVLELYARSLIGDGGGELAFRWFWPGTHRAALVLTHDVEGVEGIRLAVELADLEESLGFRSSFNFGAWYDIDPGVLRELEARGFEVGMHSNVHDRSLFSSREEFERQLPLLRALADRLGAVGFRSPATHRVFEWLQELPVQYDCTIPHSDPYEPQPGGCCSLWPFFVGDVVELPYTLPQDHTLLTLLQHRSPRLWLDTAAAIEKRFGLIQCVTHPDPGYLGDPPKRAIYAEFLRGMAERPAVWRALPRDAAAWWRLRDAEAAEDGRLTTGIVEIGEDAMTVRIHPPTSTAFHTSSPRAAGRGASTEESNPR